MKKTPIQKAEEYLQKAKDILANTPIDDISDDGILLHYADVKNVKKAGRTAWKGCSIALNYALEKNIETYDYKAYEEETRKIGDRLYNGFDIAYYALAIYMSVDGNQSKNICDDGIERAEYLIDMCKNIQSVIEQIEEEKRDREERMKKFNSTKMEDMRIVKRQSKELFELLLEKESLTKKEFLEQACQEFVKQNRYLLTPEEKKRFDYLVF